MKYPLIRASLCRYDSYRRGSIFLKLGKLDMPLVGRGHGPRGDVLSANLRRRTACNWDLEGVRCSTFRLPQIKDLLPGPRAGCQGFPLPVGQLCADSTLQVQPPEMRDP